MYVVYLDRTFAVVERASSPFHIHLQFAKETSMQTRVYTSSGDHQDIKIKNEECFT